MKIRRPTLKMFLLMYGIAWACLCWFLAAQIPARPLAGIIVGNLIMVAINLIGTIVAASTGWAPWRETNERY
jgi:hypothetical protein